MAAGRLREPPQLRQDTQRILCAFHATAPAHGLKLHLNGAPVALHLRLVEVRQRDLRGPRLLILGLLVQSSRVRPRQGASAAPLRDIDNPSRGKSRGALLPGPLPAPSR